MAGAAVLEGTCRKCLSRPPRTSALSGLSLSKAELTKWDPGESPPPDSGAAPEGLCPQATLSLWNDQGIPSGAQWKAGSQSVTKGETVEAGGGPLPPRELRAMSQDGADGGLRGWWERTREGAALESSLVVTCAVHSHVSRWGRAGLCLRAQLQGRERGHHRVDSPLWADVPGRDCPLQHVLGWSQGTWRDRGADSRQDNLLQRGRGSARGQTAAPRLILRGTGRGSRVACHGSQGALEWPAGRGGSAGWKVCVESSGDPRLAEAEGTLGGVCGARCVQRRLSQSSCFR